MSTSNSPSPAHRRAILTATILASSMSMIDGTVVGIALPALQATLGATLTDVQWVTEAYTLFLASLMLTGGALGDRLGRKRIFMIGVAVFTAGSIACGLAPGIRVLIALRAVQGIGAALMVPGSLAIINATFPAGERGKAIGTWSAFTSITMVIGPLVGGFLIDQASWRAIFFINAPFALAVIFLAWRYMPETRDRERRGVDIAGAALATAGLGSLIYGLIESSTLGFAHMQIIATLAAGALLLAGFVVVEARSASPMMPLALFRSRAFTTANLLTLFLYAALAGCLFFVPMNLIQLHGFSATRAGAAMIPTALLLFLLSRWAGALADRVGPKPLLIVGPIIAAAGFALFLLGGPDNGYWIGFFPAFTVLGLGLAITVAPLTTTVMGAVPKEQSGIASGINNAVAEGAGLLAVAVFGLAMAHSFAPHLERTMGEANVPAKVQEEIRRKQAKLAAIEIPTQVPPAQRQVLEQAIAGSFMAGFRLVMILGAGLAVLAALCAVFTPAKQKT